MSLSLDVNNFCEDGIYPRLSSACSNFDNLFTTNKDFLENTNLDVESSNHCALINQARSGHKQSLFVDAKSCNDVSFFHDSSNSTTNRKDSKIGTINVYNKCLFLVNDNNKLNAKANHCDTSTPNLCFEDYSVGNTIESAFNHRHHNDSLPQSDNLNFKSINFPSTAKSNNCVNFNSRLISKVPGKRQSPKSKQHKLFLSHNNELKPIISPMIKSGVYRKSNVTNDTNASRPNKSNVCLSTKEVCGKVITLQEFRENYVEEGTARNAVGSVTKKDFDQHILYSPPPVPSPEMDMKSSGSSDCSSTQNEWNTFAQKIMSSREESNNIIIDKEKNEIIYKNPITKKCLRYRLIRPQYFDDLKNSNQNNFSDSILSIQDCLLPFHDQTKTPTVSRPSRRGRPRKVHRQSSTSAPVVKQATAAQHQNTTPVVLAKTRYGRLSKLPNHIQEGFKVSVNGMRDPSKVSQVRSEIEDKDYKCNTESATISNTKELVQNCNSKVRKERNIPQEYQCKVCNKILLGRRIQRHYEVYPDHDINRNQHKLFAEMSLYKFLVKKIKLSSASAENRADIFLNEVSDLVEQLQSRSSRFVQNTSGMHFVNSRTSKVLGIPEGHYRIDVDEIDAPPDPRVEENSNLIAPPAPRLDYNLSISLDDTIADAKLNMITSDDSLLRTVNDLMEEGIKNLTGGNHVMDNAVHHHPTPVIHYDHASDNAVEAVSIKETQPPALLDLSLDLFQFNSN